jgi:hypothetical protein
MHRGEKGVPDNPYGETDTEWAQFATTVVHGTQESMTDLGDFNAVYSSSETFNNHTISGLKEADKTILVIGDSHSMMWYPALDVAAGELGYRLILAGTYNAAGGLYPLTDDFSDGSLSGDEREVQVRQANMRFDWIRENLWPEADVVIVGISSDYFTGEYKYQNAARSYAAAGEIARTFEEIEKITGRKPVLIQDIPFIADYSPEYVSWLDKEDHAFVPDDAQMDGLKNALHAMGKEGAFAYLAIRDIIADRDGVAHTQVGGVPVYYDDTHVNTLYAASAGEYFTGALRAMGL